MKRPRSRSTESEGLPLRKLSLEERTEAESIESEREDLAHLTLASTDDRWKLVLEACQGHTSLPLLDGTGNNIVVVRIEYNLTRFECSVSADLPVFVLYVLCIERLRLAPLMLAVTDYAVGVGPIYHYLLELDVRVGTLCEPLHRLPLKVLVPHPEEGHRLLVQLEQLLSFQ